MSEISPLTGIVSYVLVMLLIAGMVAWAMKE